MKHTVNSPQARDLRSHLHPFTNLAAHAEVGPSIFTRGEGIHVFDDSGRGYIEGLAGLWCASLGFSEDRLVDAAMRQMKALPFYHNFAHKAVEPAIDLADYLVDKVAAPMGKVFFTNSGSEANDTQVKLVRYYNNILGRPQKKKIIARRGAYHGITLAAASLTGLQYSHNAFDVPLPGFLHVTCPHAYHFARDDESEAEFVARLVSELEQLIETEGPETIAAFIAEPVMGAGGVFPPPRGYFEAIQPLLRQHDILFIADEVITGFYRTGGMLGSDTCGIRPDTISMAKALSGGYQPIGAVMITDEIHAVLVEGSRRFGLFGHGFTYSGHPVPAAVALETQRIYDADATGAHVGAISPRFQARLRALGRHPLVGEARGVGLIGAVELVEDKAARRNFDPGRKVGAWVVQAAMERGLILRALMNDTVAICPPLIITEAQIDELFDALSAALDDALAVFGPKG
jgi:4-aminobutyrate--pyruvate transaminase